MASVKARVKPELLRWARESAGFDIPEASKKLSVKPQRVKQWEDGEDSPTIIQLKKMGRVYKRPISVFYLPNPPKDFQAMHDFRRLPGEVAGQYTPTLRMASRMSQQRRELALELWREFGDDIPRFSLRASLDTDADQLAGRIRKALNASLVEQSTWSSADESFRQWRIKMEAMNILVFQARGIERSEMRAFSIAERTLPVITVNAADSSTGKIFSLFHEFVHLMLHEGGMCDFDEEYARPPEEQRVEVFCNRVATTALIPAGSLLKSSHVMAQTSMTSWSDEDLLELSRYFCVSREVVLRRLLTLDRTTNNFYRKKRQQFLKEYESHQKKAKEKARTQAGGPSPSRLAVSNYGKSFVRLVLNTYHQDRITLSDVSEYLGVRVKHLPKIETAAGTR